MGDSLDRCRTRGLVHQCFKFGAGKLSSDPVGRGLKLERLEGSMHELLFDPGFLAENLSAWHAVGGFVSTYLGKRARIRPVELGALRTLNQVMDCRVELEFVERGMQIFRKGRDVSFDW